MHRFLNSVFYSFPFQTFPLKSEIDAFCIFVSANHKTLKYILLIINYKIVIFVYFNNIQFTKYNCIKLILEKQINVTGSDRKYLYCNNHKRLQNFCFWGARKLKYEVLRSRDQIKFSCKS